MSCCKKYADALRYRGDLHIRYPLLAFKKILDTTLDFTVKIEHIIGRPTQTIKPV